MYVERSELEASLKGAMNDSAVEPNGIYLIVYGPKGTGKTTTVNHLAQMSPEAMVIQVADTTLEATILDSIARKKSFQYDTGSRESFTEAFKSHTQKITTTHTVIVFDVLVSWNDDAESKGLGMVTSLSKEFADFCEVVVLIHNPSAAILLNTDTYSRQFICVEDFSEEEAIQFCQNLVPELPVEDDELHQLFATVGTRPTMLIRLHQDLISGSVR